jgi:hypothetical protein
LEFLGFRVERYRAASQQRGNNLKGLENFDLKAKARIWP